VPGDLFLKGWLSEVSEKHSVTTISTNPTRAQLLARKSEINSKIREYRHKLDLPGATATQADVTAIDGLLSDRDSCSRASAADRAWMRSTRGLVYG
jgi:hypothetical protein